MSTMIGCFPDSSRSIHAAVRGLSPPQHRLQSRLSKHTRQHGQAPMTGAYTTALIALACLEPPVAAASDRAAQGMEIEAAGYCRIPRIHATHLRWPLRGCRSVFDAEKSMRDSHLRATKHRKNPAIAVTTRSEMLMVCLVPSQPLQSAFPRP